jgi:diguanylate cyclase (GGDEF)-like protein
LVFASKVGKIYPYLHLILLGACLLWYRFGRASEGSAPFILISLLAYALIILLFGWLGRRRYCGSSNIYFGHAIFDAAIISIVIRCTGGYNSEFYLAFFPVVALASVGSTGWRAYIGAIWYGICYWAAVYPVFSHSLFVQTFMLRLISIWFVGIVVYAIAESMRSSEKKLLKTLDVLNERTWELESSQAQLSDIYETTRALSGILDLRHLLEAVLDVAHRIFRLQKCQIYLSNVTADCLYLHASLGNGNKRIFEKPPMHVRDTSPLLNIGDRTTMMSRLNFENRQDNTDYLDIPLVSRGKVIGIMRVETEKGTMPDERERHLLMIFANSAAVAIDNSLLHKKAEELTILDELTELFNYRYFRIKLADELRRADRYRQRFSILMLDLDHFKKVNDEFGHQTGNIVLREISGIIKQCVRDVDIVARYGGEEFVVILPQTGDNDAMIIAERMRSTVQKTFFSNSQGQRDIQLTVSIGVASYPNGVKTLDQLIEKVDKAMYKAKTDGRNRVHIADHVKTTPINVAV